MIFCTKCGKQFDELTGFCPACGTPAQKQAAQPQYQQQQAQPQYQQPQYQQQAQPQYQQPQYQQQQTQPQYQQPQYQQQQAQPQYQQAQPQYQQQPVHQISGLSKAAKILMIVGTICSAFCYLIPLSWTIPMTVVYCKKLNRGEHISTGFKVCCLIFVSTLGGIFMLCDKNN